jgi:glutamine amidotransferase-like uncharacterized protein
MFLTVKLSFKMKEIVVYSDSGASRRCVRSTIDILNKFVGNNYIIRDIKAEEVISGSWLASTALFVMPGGADIPYTQKLNGQGNDNISEFVNNGGAYLGICAGSYYGGNAIEFDKGGKLEVIGERELGFFPGPVVGPLVPYDYLSNSGTRALSIDYKDYSPLKLYYQGGGYFPDAQSYQNVKVLATYQQNNEAAIIRIDQGLGQVVLSGIHFEYSESSLLVDDIYEAPLIAEIYATYDLRQAMVADLFANELGLTL